jgi:hypothetical protein
MRKLVLMLAAVAAAVPAHAQERWDLSAAQVTVRFNAGLVRDLGISLAPSARLDRDGYAAYQVGADGRMVAVAPGSIYSTVDMGELQLLGGPSLSWKGDAAALRGGIVKPGAEPNTFTISGADGAPLFFADHQHFAVDREARSLRMFNMDLRLSPELAERLGEPRHSGLPVGVLEINVAAAIPRGGVEQPLGGCTTPNWGNPHNDVSLINMSQVSQVARDSASGAFVVAISPSAVLKNVGVTDVPWISKFSPPQPPYNNDQHPYLIWNMYRVTNGRLEQIGASGLKHAFLTLNTNCGCPSGSILWVNCEDTYGVSTNNSTGSLSPRSEITAHTGVWQRCGSIFDPDCNGVQNSAPPFAGAADKRRLTVMETDLQTAGAQYYFDSWYVVRDDVNIFNTMAYRPVTTSFNGSTWSFGLGAQTFGGVIDAWVNPASPGANADSRRVDTGAGKLTIAVRATSVGGGRWRYDYALMNHDYDNGVSYLSVPLPTNAVVTNTYFHDVDRDATTDWVPTVTSSAITFQPPTNPRTPTHYFMDWGLTYTFSFEVNAAPTAAGGSSVTLGALDGPTRAFSVVLLAPSKQ